VGLLALGGKVEALGQPLVEQVGRLASGRLRQIVLGVPQLVSRSVDRAGVRPGCCA